MFISFGIKAHSLDGVYECKTSSWSPFKTKVEVKNFKKGNYDRWQDGGKLQSYTANVYFDGSLVKIADRSHHYIESSSKKSVKIHLRHDNNFYNFSDNNSEGVKYIVTEKEFSEKSGSKWVDKINVFCEKQ